jgi:Domain of unknown function (DUF5667)
MKRFSEQLKKKSESIRLRASEKAELQSRIVAFMEYHPLPSAVKNSPVPKGKVSIEPYRLIAVPRHHIRNFIGAAAMLFVVVVPAIAENAIPGDILYPVKVNVTEEIRGQLNTNAYDKVVWETTRLQRRVSEARLLAQAGKLTPEVEAGVLSAVQVHSDAAKREIESLRSTDADGAALAQMTFATVLGVQSSVLKSDGSASTTAGKSTVALSSALDAGYNEVSSTNAVDSVSVVRLIAQLEIETTRSYELLETIVDLATAQEQEDVRRRLADVESKIEVATKTTNTETDAVKNQLRSAWTDIQKLISFMTDIDVRATLTVETLVPAVLTSDEKLAQSVVKYDKALINLKRIEMGLPLITDEAISEKVALTVPKISDLLTTASSTLFVNVDDAKVAVDEALALTESILPMYQFPNLSSVPTETPVFEVPTSTEDTIDEIATTTASTTTTE